MALQPSNATVTVDGNKFNAYSAHVGIKTVHNYTGMPQMGVPNYIFECSVNAHDTDNLPFSTLNSLFSLANIVNKDKIVDIKMEFWQDEKQDDAICTYSFRGWISEFHTSGGSGGNHSMHLTFVPELGTNQYVNIKMGN
jgi:hypothetical protein